MKPRTGPGYKALHESVAWRIDPERVVLRVQGKGVVRALNGLLSANVAALAVDRATLSFILTPKGRPVALPRVLRLPESVLLDVSRAAVGGLLDHFSVYLPPRFARVDTLEGMTRASLLGPAWPEAAARLRRQPDTGEVETPPGEILTVPLPGLEGDDAPLAVGRDPREGVGLDLYVRPGSRTAAQKAISAAVDALGGDRASDHDFETWRIEMGIPLYGREISADTLPQETSLVEAAVSFDKGCYTGQEVVARIHYRGHVNRHLRGLRGDRGEGTASLAPGDTLRRGARSAGVVTSFCDSPRYGPIALAYVRREASPGDILTGPASADTEWTLSDIPFTSR